ncbi:unnamed protein product, partial [Caretta caretta]
SDETDHFTFGVGPKPPNAVIGHYTQVWIYDCSELWYETAEKPESLWIKFRSVSNKGDVVVGVCYRPPDQGDETYSKLNRINHVLPFLSANPCKYEYTFSNCRQLKTQHTCKHPFVLKYCLLHVSDNHQLGKKGNQVAKCEPVSLGNTEIEDNCKEEEGK